ncbi:MAG: guanylate kinase [Ruminococcaceae bacterium]|nr:guanylate kinase [Oscillospiraceae bacterium]
MSEQKQGLLLIVSGPAGSGKGTVLRQLMSDPRYVYSVSATTRHPRPEDKEGVTYYFFTREQFLSKVEKGEMLEYTQYVGNYYGTPKEKVSHALREGKNVILEIETDGAMQVKKLMPDAVSVMLLPPDYATLEGRLRGRGTEDEETILKRLKTAVDEVALCDRYDYIIVNETGKSEQAVQRLREIVAVEQLRPERDPDFKARFFAKG